MFSILSLLDDIASTLDDVAVMTKVAIKKTSALMSDDLAVNATVVHGVDPDRELPIVWAIFLGSLVNKIYCLIGIFALQSFFPILIEVILFVGGCYLSYEGVHKIIEKLGPKSKQAQANLKNISEQTKIKDAIRTDLILSIEIMVIAKSHISGDLTQQVLTLSVVGLLVSVLIYGLVASIVKIDDFGLYLIQKNYRTTGLWLVRSMPYIMRFLGVIGTTAMLLVGGGILGHFIHFNIFSYGLLQDLVFALVCGVLIVVVLEVLGKFKKNNNA